MQKNQPKNIKINLQIRRQKKIMESPNHQAKIPLPTTKSSNHSKKLNLTICNRYDHQKSAYSILNIQGNQKITVSQFRLGDLSPNWNLFPKNLNLSRSKIILEERNDSIRRQQINCDFLDRGQKANNENNLCQKKQVILQIKKKEAQIQFYKNLHQQKQILHEKEKAAKNQCCQKYLQNLINIYQLEVQKAQQLTKRLKQLREDSIQKALQKRREVINFEGKMGLNFSPKQLSTFSGMSGESILIQSMQKHHSGEQKQKRCQLYSFGSSNKILKSRSVGKQAELINFLNPGRVLRIQRKRIAFD